MRRSQEWATWIALVWSLGALTWSFLVYGVDPGGASLTVFAMASIFGYLFRDGQTAKGESNEQNE